MVRPPPPDEGEPLVDLSNHVIRLHVYQGSFEMDLFPTDPRGSVKLPHCGL